MNILENLCWVCGINWKFLSKEEQILLDALLLDAMCEQLMEIYQEEGKMDMSSNVVTLMLVDLIKSQDYTISGVATYANLPEDVIYDIAIGTIHNPTLETSRKIIQLHVGARSEIYQRVMQKITTQYVFDNVKEKGGK
ncbi:MAG: hypothetical protein ACD_45C00375G0002 [uncultured bacterium]|nr:MAG: hypothetical protein ACD_45C00375G0002 [uncultured bacterium]